MGFWYLLIIYIYCRVHKLSPQQIIHTSGVSHKFESPEDSHTDKLAIIVGSHNLSSFRNLLPYFKELRNMLYSQL